MPLNCALIILNESYFLINKYSHFNLHINSCHEKTFEKFVYAYLCVNVYEMFIEIFNDISKAIRALACNFFIFFNDVV